MLINKCGEVFSAATVILLLILSGCGDQNAQQDPDMTGKYPAVDITPTDICQHKGNQLSACEYELDIGAVSPGETTFAMFTLRNTGERPLLVKHVVIEGRDSPVYDLEIPPEVANSIQNSEGFMVVPLGEGDEFAPEEFAIRVSLVRPDDDSLPEADLVIHSDAFNNPELRIHLVAKAVFPKLQVTPTWIDFLQVPEGETREESINLYNTGGADLAITGFMASGSTDYSLSIHGAEFLVGMETAAGISLDNPLVIPPGEMTYIRIRFAPTSPDAAVADMLLFSNDQDELGGTSIKITGNDSVPCIAVNPEQLSFGGKAVGTTSIVPLEISSCGESPLEIYGLLMAEGSSLDFAVDTASLEFEPTADNPLVIPIGGKIQVNISFTPDIENPVDQDQQILLDTGILVIENNSFNPFKEVFINGAGADPLCPIAIIKIEEGDEVVPQTALHLIGDESYSSQGVIVKWQWEVEAPVGSVEKLHPSSTFPNPVFTPNIAGVYTFKLTVFDDSNTSSCYPAVSEVLVIPKNAVHIELLWHTPGDPDETDTGPESGSDLDLHFKHPWASGPDIDNDQVPDGWFDIPFDCFWFNAKPNWGNFDPDASDNPSLDRDDTDGGGPENVNLDEPENNVTYCAGVHYWNDHGYGPAFATIRVYIYSLMVFEVADVKLHYLDMWDALCIDWPSGKVTLTTDPVTEEYKITPNYSNPYFISP
jgi:hypothetical protein